MFKRFTPLLFCALLSLCAFFSPKKEQEASAPQITEQKPFVLIVTAYNAGPWVEKNLQSILSQDYDSFRVIYVDDGSTDDTLDRVKTAVHLYDSKSKVQVLCNHENKGALQNYYQAALGCQNHEICLFLKGDDFLAHEAVLSRLNEVYADHNVWLTYGGSLQYPQYQPTPNKINPPYKKGVKKRTALSDVHLLSCYGALIHQLPVKELLFQGAFYPVASMQALFYPLSELAGEKKHLIKEPLYLHNTTNPLSENRLYRHYRKEVLDHLTAQNPLPSLESLSPSHIQQKADMIIFSEDNPLQLECFLSQIGEMVQDVEKVWVLYRASNLDFESGYLELKLSNPSIHFLNAPFEKCIELAQNQAPPYTEFALLCTDSMLIKEKIYLSKCIRELNQTKAFAYFLSHHPNLTYCSELNRYQPLPPIHTLLIEDNPVNLWQFSSGMDDWNAPQNFYFTLYRKKDLCKIEKEDFNQHCSGWSETFVKKEIGLFPPQSLCFSLELDKTKKEKLNHFYSGSQIDLPPILQLNPISQSVEVRATYISADSQ